MMREVRRCIVADSPFEDWPRPSETAIQALLSVLVRHGFPGILGDEWDPGVRVLPSKLHAFVRQR